MDRETAEAIAAEALAFLAAEPVRLRRFFLTSGLEPAELRARAGTPEVLSAVLEYLSGDESLLLVFAASHNVAAESIGAALVLLQAPAP
jgi:hypothetical protein